MTTETTSSLSSPAIQKMMNDPNDTVDSNDEFFSDEIHDEKWLVEQYIKVEQWCYDQIYPNITKSSGEGQQRTTPTTTTSNHSETNFLYDPVVFEKTLKYACKELKFPYQSLQSFFRTIHLKHIKSISYKVKNNFQSTLLQQYIRGEHTIKQIAQQHQNYSPYLLARQIVEHIAILPTRKGLINAMRHPEQHLGTINNIREEFRYTEEQWMKQQQQQGISTTTTLTRLATEVKEALDSDPLYGPISDRRKHFIGIEYEVALEHMLQEMGAYPVQNVSDDIGWNGSF
jgi:hypothetical protein